MMMMGGYILPSLVSPKITVNRALSFLPPPRLAIGTLLVPLKSYVT